MSAESSDYVPSEEEDVASWSEIDASSGSGDGAVSSGTGSDDEAHRRPRQLRDQSRMSSSTSATNRLAQCVEFLRSLTPEGLDSDETYAPLVETGCALFKSQVLKRAFGQEDVLSYMRDQLEQKRLLKKLEKLAQRINEVHEGRLRKAKFAGINTQRQESWMSIQAGEMPTALMEAPPVGLLGSATGTLAAPPDFSQDAEATKQVLDASSALGTAIANASGPPPVSES